MKSTKIKDIKIHRGQVITELLVAIGASVLLIPTIFAGFVTSREGRVQQDQRIQANALAEGAIEAIRVVREADWDNVSTNGVYHPLQSGGSWILVPGTETINDFTRSLTITSVERNASGVIVTSGGTVDPSTKKVVSMVSWGSPIATNVSVVTYLTRLTSEERIETTVADFDAGTTTGTSVTNLAGGEVQLGGGGFGDWCNPELTIAALNLEGQGIAQGVTAIPGQAFIGTGQNASGYAFYKVDISNTDPPVATSPIKNWYNNGQNKTNGVFGETNHAYIATDTNSEELIIIDTTTNPLSKSGYFNPSANTDGLSIFVQGNVGYLAAADNKLYSFDLSSKSGSRPQVGSVALAGTPTKVYVVGTYAYIAISGNTSVEMQIVDISTPSAMSVVGSMNVSGVNGVDVYVDEIGSRAYLATAASVSQPELFIINITNKSGPTLVTGGTYDTNGMDPRGIRLVPGNRALIGGHGGQEYQVVNVTNEGSPVRCGGLDVNFNINGISSVVEADGQAFSYLLTDDANNEFRIIEGGPGGGVSATGTFMSQIFDAGKDTAFNRFIVTEQEVANSTLRYQIGVGDQVGGVCSGSALTFVGPDGTSGTFFDNGGVIPFDDDGLAYENPGRCFAYKAYFDSPVGTPVLYDVTISYSP